MAAAEPMVIKAKRATVGHFHCLTYRLPYLLVFNINRLCSLFFYLLRRHAPFSYASPTKYAHASLALSEVQNHSR